MNFTEYKIEYSSIHFWNFDDTFFKKSDPNTSDIFEFSTLLINIKQSPNLFALIDIIIFEFYKIFILYNFWIIKIENGFE